MLEISHMGIINLFVMLKLSGFQLTTMYLVIIE